MFGVSMSLFVSNTKSMHYRFPGRRFKGNRL